MKKIFFALSLLCAGCLFAQTETRAKINSVTIYFDGALVEKNAKVALHKGENTFVIKGNSYQIAYNSLQFSASEDFWVTDFSTKRGYAENKLSYERSLSDKDRVYYLRLKDSARVLQNLLAEQEAYKRVLEKEIAVLSGFQPISQPQMEDSLPSMRESLVFYRQKMQEITKEQIANREKIMQYKEAEIDIDHLLTNFYNKFTYHNQSEYAAEDWITVNVYSEKEIASADLNFSYIVNSASWSPSYDVKISSDKDEIELLLKAKYSQQSGEDWDDVALSFSPESVRKEQVSQSIQPYLLSNTQVAKSTLTNERMAAKMANNNVQNDMAVMECSIPLVEQGYGKPTTSVSTPLGRDYILNKRHNVKSSDETKTMVLQTQKTKASYRYDIKPKLSNKASFNALIASWQDLELTDAEANVYFDNKYSTKSAINPSSTQSNSLRLPFGTDKRINVRRKVSRTTPEKTSLMGKEMETIVEITIQVKNNSLKEAEAVIEDQIPISQDAEIKIQTLDLSGADLEAATGKLRWKKSLKASEQLTLKVKYSVRYPKDYVLNLN